MAGQLRQRLEDELLLVSVGTGAVRREDPVLAPGRMTLWYTVQETPRALIYAADREQDLLWLTFGRCLMGDAIDLEVGDLRHGRTAVVPKLFTYFRINARLTREGLAALGCAHIDPADVQHFDGVRHVGALRDIVRALGERAAAGDLVARLGAARAGS